MAMESQLTLVTVDSAVRLTFNRDNMKNATISLDSAHAYTITTDAQNMYTELRAVANGELLAPIVRKAILPDTIAFPTVNDGQELQWRNSLRGRDSPTTPRRHTIDTEHGLFILKAHPLHRLAVRAFPNQTTYRRWLRVGNASAPTLVICTSIVGWIQTLDTPEERVNAHRATARPIISNGSTSPKTCPLANSRSTYVGRQRYNGTHYKANSLLITFRIHGYTHTPQVSAQRSPLIGTHKC
ncbi:hypothetical protein DFH08DRAFT_816383 [Mycena albidolilacea]|uniref:Uncharacterized protein n=1 Tax=Mycena albidolilacea TaxID=1033008 RepID=A0AAD6ZKB4_9AGAR|nr:hypothetical protein DFH08DRAFT_816383 [Mycena albidolilacea]